MEGGRHCVTKPEILTGAKAGTINMMRPRPGPMAGPEIGRDCDWDKGPGPVLVWDRDWERDRDQDQGLVIRNKVHKDCIDVFFMNLKLQ